MSAPYRLPIIPILLSLLTSLVLGLSWLEGAAAQEGRLRFERLTIEDGLSQNTVNAILQDRLGFMWFATEGGLNRYNGYTFTAYRHNPADPDSISSSRVLALFEDGQGRIWVGTGAGLDRFEPETERFVHSSAKGAVFAGGVQAVAEDSAGRLWVGTAGGGLWVLDPESGEWREFLLEADVTGPSASQVVYDILRGKDGVMWVATDRGLHRCDPESGLFQQYNHQAADPLTPTSNLVRALWEDQRGNLWIGTEGGGLNQLDLQLGLFTFYMNSAVDPNSLGDNAVWDILEDAEGDLWLATQRGLDRFDRENWRFSHYLADARDPLSLSANTILSLYQDRSGILWIGTQGGGLSLYKPGAHKFRLFRPDPLSQGGLSGSSVSSILEDSSGDLWVGTTEAGLNRLDRETGEWMAYRRDPSGLSGLSSDNISALALDQDGSLWIGTSGSGLDRLDLDTGSTSRYRRTNADPESLSSNVISSLLVDRAGTLWAGTLDAGLNRLDPGSGGFTHYRHDPEDPESLSGDGVTVMLEAGDGTLWVGTFNGGLNRFDPASGRFRGFRHNPQDLDSLSSDRVYSLAESPDGALWVGTQNGLNRFEPHNERFTRYTSQDGLPGEIVCGTLIGDSGELWISTTGGLARFDSESGDFRSYSTEDGLQSREFNPGAYFKSSRGELFFGGVLGFNAFFPSEVADQLIPPPVVVTAFKVQNQTMLKNLTGGQPVRLSYRDDFISFEFAALDYQAPNENRFAYKLEGFDRDWVEAGKRAYASYTNLPGGSYTFRLKAANSDGAWNEEGLAIPLEVTPPLWEAAWFQACLLLALVGAAYGGYRWRLRGVRLRNLELEKRVAELSRQVKEAAVLAERSRLARDLHDSVTQSLYSLTLLAEAGQRMLEAGKLDESRQNQRRLGEIAGQALQEMRLLVYELRPPALEKTGLVGALEQRLEAVERRAGITARLILEGEVELSSQVEEDLYYLAQEALNNALKHSGSRRVTVRLRCIGGRASLEVQDDGRGFDPSAIRQRAGMGLTGMRERAEKLGGCLHVRSSLGAGTTIEFSTFPEDQESEQSYKEVWNGG